MQIEALLTDVAACLCAQIVTDGSPAVCFCGVVPGIAAASPYMRDCGDNECGMAWVRLSSVYASQSVGQAVTTPSNCALNQGVDIEVGIMRCFPAIDRNGNGPEASALLAISEQSAKDAMTIWRALYCCSSLENDQFIMGAWSPLGPEADLIGGSWTVSVFVD